MAGLSRNGVGATAMASAWVGAAVLIAQLTGCSPTIEADVIATSSSPANPSEGVPTESGISPSPTPTMPPESCEPSDFPRASLPGASLPTPGEPLTLELDPCLTAKSLLGSYVWLENQGIDADLIQGFQSVAGVEPWTAPLVDGSGRCILIRADDRNGWGTIACDSTGLSATVERNAGASVLRFVIENGTIAVYAASP